MQTRSRPTSRSSVGCCVSSSRSGPSCRLSAVAESGTVNALYRLGDELVVRIPRNRPSLWSDLDDEFTWLPRLAPLLPVAVPMPVARGRPSGDYPHEWGIFEWLPGENPTPGEVRRVAGRASWRNW